MTSKTEIGTWFDRGVADGATHMIVVCDTFDWDDYPVYVSPQQDPAKVKKQYDRVNMQKVMEVYDLAGDREAQLNMGRAMAV